MVTERIVIKSNQSINALFLPVDCRVLQNVVSCMLNIINSKKLFMDSVELYLVSDSEISLFNWQFMGCEGPTNILSFPGDESLPGTLLLSVDSFLRECRIYGQEKIDHLLRLVAHGLCHLAGHEHGVVMEQLTEKCVAEAKIFLCHCREHA